VSNPQWDRGIAEGETALFLAASRKLRVPKHAVTWIASESGYDKTYGQNKQRKYKYYYFQSASTKCFGNIQQIAEA
jgi:hypothetical protein